MHFCSGNTNNFASVETRDLHSGWTLSVGTPSGAQDVGQLDVATRRGDFSLTSPYCSTPVSQ